MATPLLLLRAVQLGVQIGEMDLLTIGTINEKKKALIQIPMDEAMERIKVFVRPLLEDISPGGSNWNPDTGRWE